MIIFVIALSLLGAPEEAGQDHINFFEEKIRPVLAERCYQCHSAEAARRGMLMGKLQLDTRKGVQRGGSRGSVVVAGRPDQSMLIEALEYTNPNLQMPPGGKLPDEVTADFVQWVALGAPDPRDAQSVDTAKMDLESGRLHWAFRPLRPVDPPQVSAQGHLTLKNRQFSGRAGFFSWVWYYSGMEKSDFIVPPSVKEVTLRLARPDRRRWDARPSVQQFAGRGLR